MAGIEGAVYLLAPELLACPGSALIKSLPIWTLALVAYLEAPTGIKRPLALSLAFSGMGDFALNTPQEMAFPIGMAAFLLAHLCYLWIFSRTLRKWADLDLSRRVVLGLIAVYAITMGVVVLPKTGSLLPAIAVYFAVLSLMAAASFASLAPRWTRMGAVLFVISDTLIGIDKFLMPIEFRHLAVMGTYYAAQFLILAGLCWQQRKT
jgi:uncharacterized membrane protein YhhN